MADNVAAMASSAIARRVVGMADSVKARGAATMADSAKVCKVVMMARISKAHGATAMAGSVKVCKVVIMASSSKARGATVMPGSVTARGAMTMTGNIIAIALRRWPTARYSSQRCNNYRQHAATHNVAAMAASMLQLVGLLHWSSTTAGNVL